MQLSLKHQQTINKQRDDAKAYLAKFEKQVYREKMQLVQSDAIQNDIDLKQYNWKMMDKYDAVKKVLKIKKMRQPNQPFRIFEDLNQSRDNYATMRAEKIEKLFKENGFQPLEAKTKLNESSKFKRSKTESTRVRRARTESARHTRAQSSAKFLNDDEDNELDRTGHFKDKLNIRIKMADEK